LAINTIKLSQQLPAHPLNQQQLPLKRSAPRRQLPRKNHRE
jgi:hypothetical protein